MNGVSRLLKGIGIWLAVLPLVSAATLEGKVTRLGGGKALFKYLRTEENLPNGNTIVTRKFLDLKGDLAVETIAVLKDNHLIKSTTNQSQTGERGRIWVEGKELKFEYEKDGKTKHASEKVEEPLVGSDQIVPHLRGYWKELMEHKTLEIRFPVWHRLETVGFKFFLDSEKSVRGINCYVIKMKPQSFIIAALVDPLYFYFSKENNELVRLEGRTDPKILKGKKWADLDAWIDFDLKASH